MLFIQWYLVAYVLAAVLLLTGSIWLRNHVHHKNIVLKVAAGASFVPSVLLSMLASILVLASFGCETASKPIYCPDHSKAVRIYNIDGGATGGDTIIQVFSHHGFWQSTIAKGDWHFAEPGDIRWIDSRRVAITTSYFSDYHVCSNTSTVEVDCIPGAPPTNSGSLTSPDGDKFAELHKAKDGSYQGTDAVVLTGSIRYAYVYVGDPNSVIWSRTHWKSANESEIATKNNPKACSSQSGVTVTCTLVEALP